jgi:MFS family permease
LSNTFIVSSAQLITLMSASMTAAALPQIAVDLDMGDSAAQISFSIFFLGLAFGPFLSGALSEIYGRKPVWLVFNMWYIVWNSLCPVGDSPGLMIVGRLLTGLGASVGIGLTGPVMADMFRAKNRGKSIALASLLPYLGPALGPIIGGVVSQHIHWHWLFWILSFVAAGAVALGTVFFHESCAPVLLLRRARAQGVVLHRRTDSRTLFASLRTSLARPVILLFRRPIIQLISLSFALSFGVYCIMLSTYATLYIERYHESQTLASLHYIAIAIGASLSAQAGGPLMDTIRARLVARSPDGMGRPEFRVPYMVPGTIMTAVGLFWYGWSAQHQLSWAMLDVGVIIFVWGDFMLSQALLAYLLDEFSNSTSASANAAMRFLTNVCGFAFPIFAPALYGGLGYGWGNSLLAFVFVGLQVPTLIAFWYWGERIRGWGRRDGELAQELLER